MKLSERIKKYRQDNNLTQEQFASRLFVSKQAVSKWENDRGMPDVSLYPTLAETLNVTVDELMGIDKKVETTQNIKEKKKHKKIIYILLLIACLMSLLTIVLFLTKNIRREKELYRKTENYIGYGLPNVKKFDYVDVSSMPDMDQIKESNIYYFMFEDGSQADSFEQKIHNDKRWKNNLTLDIYNSLPYYLYVFYDSSDLFWILEKEEKKYIFFAYQEQINRLIISEYEWR
ncbi:MAG: helix-turn-helix transcriptional regulator [Bacilli bacterium]|nr:helix-turn-helix transcriptional regulator [Bacilli bacterium]